MTLTRQPKLPRGSRPAALSVYISHRAAKLLQDAAHGASMSKSGYLTRLIEHVLGGVPVPTFLPPLRRRGRRAKGPKG